VIGAQVSQQRKGFKKLLDKHEKAWGEPAQSEGGGWGRGASFGISSKGMQELEVGPSNAASLGTKLDEAGTKKLCGQHMGDIKSDRGTSSFLCLG